MKSALHFPASLLVLLGVAACGSGNNTHGGDALNGDTHGGDGLGFDATGFDVTLGDAVTDVGPTDTGNTSRHVVTCPGCPCFPGTDCTGTGSDAGQPPACPGTSANPTLVYPPDQVLLPPNTNVVEVQFQPGTGNTLFEIDFQNAVTDVRIITHCTPITNSRGVATGGCGFTLDMDNWRYVADVNRGGDPVRVTVRGTNGTCVAGSAARNILFATQDVAGGIYYWQSVTVSGMPGHVGGIFRYDFGNEALAPEPFIVPMAAGTTGPRCVGCHFVSRDGLRISFGTDDADSDDEYNDVTSRLMDITNRNILSSTISAGFRTFNRDHTSMLASDGRGVRMPPAFFRYNGDTGATIDNPSTGPNRGTHPDWANDDSRVVFVRPNMFLPSSRQGGGMSPTMGDDIHFFGGSLFTAAWNGTAFATPAPLLMSTGENNFYPAFSADASLVIFDRVMGAAGIPTDAFSNPNARIWAMPAAGGTPVDLQRLNQADHLSNSWPRWSPFVQPDRGHTIQWVTFSSIRDYGLRVQNEDPNGVSCYPPDSPENTDRTHTCSLVPTSCGCAATTCPQFCVQPQIWMAAVEVDATGGITAGRDTSHPAFWLPFQEVAAHNHIAQWVTMIPGHMIYPPQNGDGGTDGGGPPPDGGGPPPDGGMCGGGNAACGAGQPLCCAAYVCLQGMCGIP